MTKHPLIARRDAAQATYDLFHQTEFAWGDNDCCKMVSHCIMGSGQCDPMFDIPTYKTARQAYRAMGGKSLAEHLESRGFKEIPLARVLPGDIVEFPSDAPHGALGISLGQQFIFGFCPLPDGSARAIKGPLSICTRAWSHFTSFDSNS